MCLQKEERDFPSVKLKLEFVYIPGYVYKSRTNMLSMIVLSILVSVAQAHSKPQDVTINADNVTCPVFEDPYPVKDVANVAYAQIALIGFCASLLFAYGVYLKRKEEQSMRPLDRDVEVGLRSQPVVLPAPRRERKSRMRQRTEIRLDTLAPSKPKRSLEISPNEVSPPTYTANVSGSFDDPSSMLP